MVNLKLLKIQGYYNYESSFNFNDVRYSWTGHIILREDLTFEGIVKDKSSEDKDSLVSGTLVESNGPSLTKFTNDGLSPCSFYGMSTGKELLGTWAVCDISSVTEQGKCKIIFSTDTSVEDNFITELENKIELFKSEMSNYNQKLYDSLIECFNYTVQQFFKKLQINGENVETEIGTILKKLDL